MLFFLEVVLGFLLAGNFHLSISGLNKLPLIFISFQLLLYSGIYILNDIIDIQSDKKHPFKKQRPIASGKISVKCAFLFALILIIAGLGSGFFISLILFYWELFFIFYNLLYSYILKKIPYLEFFANGITHPARILLGILVFGNIIDWILVISIFILSSAFSLLKRYKELLDIEKPRKTLKYYSFWKLKIFLFLFLITIFTLGLQASNLTHLTIIFELIIFFIFILGYFLFGKIKKFMDKIFSY
jgi:4-hydroxybenzoate polyprenyltransferase